MIVQCRACHMRYDLDEQVLGSKGCHVRCTSCGHIWHQAPMPKRNMLMTQPPASAEEKPVKKEGGSRSWGTWLLLLVLYGVVFTAGVYSHTLMKPWMQSWKELVWPVAPARASLELATLEWQHAGDDESWQCQGTVRNRSDHVIYDPQVIVEYSMLDAKSLGCTTHTKQHICHGVRLLPNQTCPFRILLPSGMCTDVKVSLAPQR